MLTLNTKPKAPPMNTRDKLTALKAGDTGPALAGTPYAQQLQTLAISPRGTPISQVDIGRHRAESDALHNAALCIVQRWVIAELVEALNKSKQKLELYRENHSGEYIGGLEYSELQRRNTIALDLAKQLEDL